MQFKKYAHTLLTSARGKLPTTVFVWYIIWVSAAIVTIALIIYWYFMFYGVAYNQTGVAPQREYKHIIDAKELKELLEVYDLE